MASLKFRDFLIKEKEQSKLCKIVHYLNKCNLKSLIM